MAVLTSDVVNPQLHPHRTAHSNPIPHLQAQEQPEKSQLPRLLDPKSCIVTLLNCKDVSQIRQVHTQIARSGMLQNIAVVNKLLYIYTRHGALKDAGSLFHSMFEKDAVSWSVMVGGYAKLGDHSDSFRTFRELIRSRTTPLDNFTLPMVIRSCRACSDLRTGSVVHGVAWKNGLSSDHFVCAALVDFYAKCGASETARKLFDEMSQRDLVTWTVMIGSYAMTGNAGEALYLFEQMRYVGISPDKIAMVAVVNACAKFGALNKARQVHDYITENNLSINVILGTAMIDMYAKCGSIVAAREIFDHMKDKNVITWSAMIAAYAYHGEEMDVEKDQGLWGALLGACRMHKKVELAEKAAKVLLEAKSINPGHYVLLSNIYANAGRWEEVAWVRHLMTQRKLKKLPGWTWIEVGDKVYRFGAGARDHPQAEEIYASLESLRKRLELAGYVPDTDCVLHDVEDEVKAGMLSTHSEKLAIAFGVLVTPLGSSIRITKNLRVCIDCHTFCMFVSSVTAREIIVRDSSRFHHFKEGSCSCGDYW
ncbi:hypothetical protein CRG98_032593 [Punica granatum]|uniref:DYW domain-containing protein n=1 Tax=Punica granatum TaxID=22663 RepID=A0A2I0IST5_PUNGR|nr:hypothetical protein CRG98_032593 [Punica granatum]